MNEPIQVIADTERHTISLVMKYTQAGRLTALLANLAISSESDRVKDSCDKFLDALDAGFENAIEHTKGPGSNRRLIE